MFVAILIVYPWIRHFGKEFSSTISFVIAIMIYGNIIMNFNFLGVVNEWTGKCQYGIVRAVAGVCLGCFCYYISSEIRDKNRELSTTGNYVFSAVQILLVILVLYLMEDFSGFEDVIKVILFTILIIISFSFDTKLNKICSNKICNYLGKFSTVVFVTQSVTYMYPILKYPENWLGRFGCHILYILLFSIVNYFLVEFILRVAKVLKSKDVLFVSK